MTQEMKNVNCYPFVNVKDAYIYKVDTDTAEAYTTTDIYKLDCVKSVAYAEGNSENPYYANGELKENLYTKTPTGALSYSGDTQELETLLYNYAVVGGANIVKESVPNKLGMFVKYINSNGGALVRQFLKFTAAKADETITSKEANIDYQPTTANMALLVCNKFNGFVRNFYFATEAEADTFITQLLTDVAAEVTEA